MKAISALLSGDSTASDKAFAEGFYVAGERYVTTSIDTVDSIALFRKVRTMQDYAGLCRTM